MNYKKVRNAALRLAPFVDVTTMPAALRGSPMIYAIPGGTGAPDN